MKKLLLFIVVLIALLASLGLSGMTEPASAVPAQCSDGVDNDGDTWVDYPAEPNCYSTSDNSELADPGYEWKTQCSDNKDNDGDGMYDPRNTGSECMSADDWSEQNGMQYNPSAPPSSYACSDSADNDGDSKTDYPADPGCSSNEDSSEADLPQCSDQFDNDGDGYVNYPSDPDCSSSDDNSESPSSPGWPPNSGAVCDNGIDDDNDGYIDYDGQYTSRDPGCYSSSDTDEGNVAQCGDGVDNDADGKIDMGGVGYPPAPADDGCSATWDDSEYMEQAPPSGEPVTYGLFSEGFEDDACQAYQPCARPARTYVCLHRGFAPSYFLYDEQNPSEGARVFGSPKVNCNRPVASIRLIVSLHRNTYTGSPTFVTVGGPNYTLQMEAANAENWVTYACAFWGSGIHSRSWYMRSQLQVVWPDGSISTSDKRTPRVTHMCH